MCVAEVSEGNSVVLSYLVNCYLRDCGMICRSHSTCVRSHYRALTQCSRVTPILCAH